MITVFAVFCAVAASIGFNYTAYLQKVAVDKLPRVTFKASREILSIIKAFLSSKTWLISLAVMLISSVLYSVSLVFIEVSIVTPIVASGVAFLAYLAIKNLGEKPRKIDLFAIGINITGVILIGISLAEKVSESGAKDTLKFNPWAVWLVCAGIVVLAILFPLAMRSKGQSKESIGLGISVGLLYGMTAIFARILLYNFSKGYIFNPYVLGWAGVCIPAFIIWQAALQRGLAVIVVPIQAGIAQLVPILLGMVILYEKLPKNVTLAAMRILGFVLVLAGTIILSRRSEEIEVPPSMQEENAIESAYENAP